jgi:ubiquinone/menaquinone biosynthesis C-methylase UbiE
MACGVPLLVALAGAVAWVIAGGTQAYLAGLRHVNALYLPPLLLITAFCVIVRFVRWQFLLRRANVRTPTRPSLAIFLASLAGIVTPAYVGEAVRSVFMRRRFGTPARLTLYILVVERSLDVMALGLMGALCALDWGTRLIMLLFVAGAVVFRLFADGIAAACGVPKPVVSSLRQTLNFVQALTLTVVAWAPTALLFSLAAASLQIALSPQAGFRIFSSSTLLGGAGLMPAGAGVMSGAAILEFRGLGISLASSLVIVSLVRLTTVGFSLGISTVFLALQFHRQSTANHFDEIATDYSAQFSTHIWQHLLQRKIGMISSSLPPAAATGIGLDLGCGLGLQCKAMANRGYRVVGMDLSQGLLRQARLQDVTAVAGSALRLPFDDATFDFVYTIGVLHHLPGVDAQETAFHEVNRILKPGGAFVVHETNPQNPLFRFYMGYVFPILKRIDEGTEIWLEPRCWQNRHGLKLADLQYFTFLPDFLPARLLRPFLSLERRLELTRFRRFSVHYMAVFRKSVEAVETLQPFPMEQAVSH